MTAIGTTATNDDRDPLPFGRHHAFIIGIDAYDKVPPMATMARQASARGAEAGD